jgi:hypothetical protein
MFKNTFPRTCHTVHMMVFWVMKMCPENNNINFPRSESLKSVILHLPNGLSERILIYKSRKQAIRSAVYTVYTAVENLLSSRLLSENVNIKIYTTLIFAVVLYGCET